MKIYIRHVRNANICRQGARQFAEKYNIDWHDFLKNGVDVEVLLAVNDAQVNQVVEVAKKELSHGK